MSYQNKILHINLISNCIMPATTSPHKEKSQYIIYDILGLFHFYR